MRKGGAIETARGQGHGHGSTAPHRAEPVPWWARRASARLRCSAAARPGRVVPVWRVGTWMGMDNSAVGWVRGWRVAAALPFSSSVPRGLDLIFSFARSSRRALFSLRKCA
jgi:hypothetical protein